MRTSLRNTKTRKYLELETVGAEQLVRTSKLDGAWGRAHDYRSKYRRFDDEAAALADAEKQVAAAVKKGFEVFEPTLRDQLPTVITAERAATNDVFLFRRLADEKGELDARGLGQLAAAGALDVLEDQARRGSSPAPTALSQAALQGQDAVVRWMVTQGTSPDAPGSDGDTPLMDAAQKGKADTVALLLELGADPDAKSRTGSTALMHAAIGGKPEVLGLLLDAGADPAVANERGETALSVAVEKAGKAKAKQREGRVAVCGLLLERGAPVGDLGPELAAIGLAAAGAGGPADESLREAVVGAWRLDRIHYTGTGGGDSQVARPSDAKPSRPTTLELNADGTAKLTRGFRYYPGTWRINADEVTLELQRAEPSRIGVLDGGAQLALHDFDEEHGADFDEIYVRG